MAMIHSLQNPKIQLIRKLLARRKDRKKHNLYVLEGVRLIEEAMQTGAEPAFMVYSEQLSERGMKLVNTASGRGIETAMVDMHIMAIISDTETPQGIIAAFPFQLPPIPERLNFILILDKLRDPGNLGTILRTAAAAKVQLLLLAPGSVDPWSPKVLRSAMGAHFYLPILQMDWEEIGRLLNKDNRPMNIFSTSITHGPSCWETDLSQPLALVIGNETEGVSTEAHQYADKTIRIPMPGKIESLNASIAAGVLLFEVLRQRRL